MLNVACVCVGDAYPPLYVEILYSAVRRNLPAGLHGRFIVFTDNPAVFRDMAGVQTKPIPSGMKGWWNKLYLFSKDAFPDGERVLYFDLDTVITGPLDDIAAYDGEFAILRDAYRSAGLQSSVMAWEAGSMEGVWRSFVALGYPDVDGGDQAFIETCFAEMGFLPDLWQKILPGKFRSYKKDCQDSVPRGTSVVFFHGFPRPHQATGWVKDVWKVSDETLFFAMNVKEDQIRLNIAHALTKPRWIEMRDGSQFPAIIVGGGPSLEGDLWRVKGYQLSGGMVFATNNTFGYLKERGITPDAHIMHDARPENVAFVPDSETICYYASQCHPSVLDAAGDRLVCWHPHSDVCLEVIGKDPKGPAMVSGGSTVGLNAMSLAYILGHRQFLLFGFDSSYAEDEHHAYEQKLNDGELRLEVKAEGQTFSCAPWMIQQAEQFVDLARKLVSLGCEVTVYGHGLIPTIAASAQPIMSAADLRALSILQWLKDTKAPVGAEIGVFSGDLSRRLLSRPDLSLLMVDSWAQADPASPYALGDFHGKLTQRQQDRYHEMTLQKTAFAGNRAKVIRDDSLKAAADVPDRSLDFVFIDADHTYEACKADILAWLPKVKEGGFISGHDYDNTDFPEWGVKKAVDEIFGKPELGENFTWCVKR